MKIYLMIPFLFLTIHNSITPGAIEVAKEVLKMGENYGRGQQAIDESEKKTIVINRAFDANQTLGECLKTAQENQKAAQKATEVFMRDFSKRIGKGLEENAQATTNGAHKVTQAIDKSTAAQVEINKTLQNINAGAQVIGAITGAIFIAKSAKDGVEWVQEYRNPDLEKQARKEEETEAAITRTKILRTRKQLSSCFALHRKESRDENGLPYSCNEAYHAFAAATDYENAEHLAQAFRHANPIRDSQS